MSSSKKSFSICNFLSRFYAVHAMICRLGFLRSIKNFKNLMASNFCILFRALMLTQLRWKMLLICFATLSKWYLSILCCFWRFLYALLIFTLLKPLELIICELYSQGNHPVDGQTIEIKISKSGFTIRHRRSIASVPKVWLQSCSSTMKQYLFCLFG